ncbi:MAG: NAD+ synthase [Xanthomonadales bacterium]|nr:NAD+ synthase [Gammaproteobacteria bacterium]NND56674.1 NAD+ synthase [Xanthomonadales bacterium]
MRLITLALAQHDFLVGDIKGNLRKAIAVLNDARDAGADLLLFPELALTGYPPEDLLLRPGFLEACDDAVEALASQVRGIDVVFGHPRVEDGKRFNAVSWMRDGRIIGRYAKQLLPNYAVFDEQRYFSPGSESLVVELAGVRIGVIICEDAWEAAPALQAKRDGAQLLLVPNASPYRDDKLEARGRMFEQRFRETGLPVAYCNLVGGQDELVFDGRSMLMDAQGRLSAPGPLCEETLLLAEFSPKSGALEGCGWKPAPADQLEEIYAVITRGLRDYVRKNGFSDVVFGLSGGIDSGLMLALAVDALGPERVHTVMMPSRHTSGLSIELAQEQAVQLGVDHRCISIEPAYEMMMNLLTPSFGDREPDITEENLQARIRGDIVMALSNKFGWLPLATSNKSELAVGYCTIYGDMCGGFGPLLDCFKMRVYALARYRNSLSPAIPENVITRPPSAELRPDQSDQDSLPPYEQLDAILSRYVERDWSIAQIVEEGFDEPTVRRVAGLVLLNEYKRRQAPPGVRVTHRAFGRDRRYPITSGWKDSQ